MFSRPSMRLFCWACLLASSLLLLPVAPASAQATTYKVIRRIPVTGEGGWDYLRVDPDAKRIYLSRGTHMTVVDEVSGKAVGEIPNTDGIHGVALAQDLGKGFTSNGRANTVTVFDLKTLKPTGEIKVTGENPDSIIYDPQTKRIFTFNKRTLNATWPSATWMTSPSSESAPLRWAAIPKSRPWTAGAASISIWRTRARSPALIP